jgi:hypothetical protein
MCRGAALSEVLRLLVLLNECHQGLSRRHLDSLKQEILHTYGHEHLLTLSNLERAGTWDHLEVRDSSLLLPAVDARGNARCPLVLPWACS